MIDPQDLLFDSTRPLPNANLSDFRFLILPYPKLRDISNDWSKN